MMQIVVETLPRDQALIKMAGTTGLSVEEIERFLAEGLVKSLDADKRIIV